MGACLYKQAASADLDIVDEVPKIEKEMNSIIIDTKADILFGYDEIEVNNFHEYSRSLHTEHSDCVINFE